MQPELVAGAAVLRRDVALYRSYRLRWLGRLATTVFGVSLFFYVSRLVSVDAVGGADGYFAYVVVGMVLLEVLNGCLLGPGATLRQELVAGTFERVLVSAFGPVRAIAAMALFPTVLATVFGAVTLAVAALVYGMPVRAGTVGLALPVAALTAFAFLPLGLLLSGGVLLLKQAQSGARAALAVLSLVAGVYFPVTLLPGWVQWMADVQPLTPALELTRLVVAGTPPTAPAGLLALKLAAFGAVLLPIAVVLLARGIDLARRQGTITEA